MRKIILNLAVTLDGFIEGPNGELDWINIAGSSGSEHLVAQFLPTIDTILYGRVSYDMWGQFQPDEKASAPEKELWKEVHSKKKYVFSKHPKEDGKATFISSNIKQEVEKIKAAPGKDIWLYGGSKLITTFINEGLVDNYLLAIFPVILGEGKPLFTNIRNRVGLTFNSVETDPSGIILVSYDTKR